MDFIVSKVAMAICALLVVTVLVGMFSEDSLLGRTRGFQHVLNEFCGLIDRTCASGSGASVTWTVPFLPNGESVTVSIHRGTILTESVDGADARTPAHQPHLWHSDGRPLNRSTVEALDDGAGSLTFESGQSVRIIAAPIIYDDELCIFAFVYLMD